LSCLELWLNSWLEPGFSQVAATLLLSVEVFFFFQFLLLSACGHASPLSITYLRLVGGPHKVRDKEVTVSVELQKPQVGLPVHRST